MSHGQGEAEEREACAGTRLSAARLVVVAVASASLLHCSRTPAAPAHPADPVHVPAGHGWFASTVRVGAVARTCETRPGAMMTNGTAPVADCEAVRVGHCFTFEGPSNAGPPVQCWRDHARCEAARGATLGSDFGGPLRAVSDCTPLE